MLLYLFRGALGLKKKNPKTCIPSNKNIEILVKILKALADNFDVI